MRAEFLQPDTGAPVRGFLHASPARRAETYSSMSNAGVGGCCPRLAGGLRGGRLLDIVGYCDEQSACSNIQSYGALVCQWLARQTNTLALLDRTPTLDEVLIGDGTLSESINV